MCLAMQLSTQDEQGCYTEIKYIWRVQMLFVQLSNLGPALLFKKYPWSIWGAVEGYNGSRSYNPLGCWSNPEAMAKTHSVRLYHNSYWNLCRLPVYIPSLVLRLRPFNLCIKGIMQWGCRECTHLVFLKRVLSSLFDYFYIPLQQKWKFVQFPHCFLLLLLLERALSVPRYFLPHTIYFNIHIISCV